MQFPSPTSPRSHYSINPQGLLQVPPPQPRQPLVRMLAAASLLQRQLLGEGWARCLWTGPRTVLRCWPLAEHRSTVVFLHGLGDQGDALEPLAEALQPQLRHTKFILPTAPVVSGGARAAPCALGWWRHLCAAVRLSPHAAITHSCPYFYLQRPMTSREGMRMFSWCGPLEGCLPCHRPRRALRQGLVGDPMHKLERSADELGHSCIVLPAH